MATWEIVALCGALGVFMFGLVMAIRSERRRATDCYGCRNSGKVMRLHDDHSITWEWCSCGKGRS